MKSCWHVFALICLFVCLSGIVYWFRSMLFFFVVIVLNLFFNVTAESWMQMLCVILLAGASCNTIAVARSNILFGLFGLVPGVWQIELNARSNVMVDSEVDGSNVSRGTSWASVHPPAKTDRQKLKVEIINCRWSRDKHHCHGVGFWKVLFVKNNNLSLPYDL